MTWSLAGKQMMFVVLSVLVFSLGLVPGALADDSDPDVENFHYSRWELTYDISRDAQGRAKAEVTEQLHAQFPEFDQNRGIIRSLPTRYQSAPAAPEDISVTNQDGQPVPFEVDDEDGFRSILIGDEHFVHGSQVYVITYTIADVIHATDQIDEFYWDLIPSDRAQHIDVVTAQLRLDEELTSALTGSVACYVGTPEDSQSCELARTDGEQAVFELTDISLQGGHGVTVAIGLQPGTVTQPPERHENFLLDVVPLLLVVAATLIALGGVLAIWRMVRSHRQDTSQATIRYGIPEQVNPVLAGEILGKSHDPVVATILDLAVRGVIRVEETQTSSRWLKQDEVKPVLRLLDPASVTEPLERGLLTGMFPELTPGATFDFPKNSKPFIQATESLIKEGKKAVIDRGYLQHRRHRGAVIAGCVALVLLVPVVILLVLGATRDNMTMTAICMLLGTGCLILSIICVTKHRVLTPQGAGIRQQLQRMQDLMQATDLQRLHMLQSFTQAPRHQTDDSDSVIHLYDRILPYAVQFGLQEDWTKVMANTYVHYNWPAPYWYPLLFSDHHSSAEAALGAMLSSVSSAASTASPTAGSTGAGAVGGGGGGGAAGGR